MFYRSAFKYALKNLRIRIDCNVSAGVNIFKCEEYFLKMASGFAVKKRKKRERKRERCL